MPAKKTTFHSLKKTLELHHHNTVQNLHKKYPEALNSIKQNAVGLMGGTLFATSVIGSSLTPSNSAASVSTIAESSEAEQKMSKFKNIQNILLNDPDNLDSKVEKEAEEALSYYFNIPLKAELDGNKMESSWGYFGQEQHLYRWEGDSLSAHGEELEHGIAPGRGAFGYFDNADQEKYYIAAPIHLLPNWNTDWPTLKPWYKFRKVFVYNPKNQKGAVAVVGDAGPAPWTGKQFGGSPELMAYLDMYDGSAKSRAVVLFVDDPDDKIKLGPVEHKDTVNTLAQNNL